MFLVAQSRLNLGLKQSRTPAGRESHCTQAWIRYRNVRDQNATGDGVKQKLKKIRVGLGRGPNARTPARPHARTPARPKGHPWSRTKHTQRTPTYISVQFLLSLAALCTDVADRPRVRRRKSPPPFELPRPRSGRHRPNPAFHRRPLHLTASPPDGISTRGHLHPRASPPDGISTRRHLHPTASPPPESAQTPPTGRDI